MTVPNYPPGLNDHDLRYINGDDREERDQDEEFDPSEDDGGYSRCDEGY